MSNGNVSVLPKDFGSLSIKDWVLDFNAYRSTNNPGDAVQLIWNDWAVEENPFFNILPNAPALLFALLCFVPNKDDGSAIGNVPTGMAWDDPPLYDTNENALYNITPWNCADWKLWHMELEHHYGDTYKANAIWESAWQHEDNWCSYVISCPITEWCRYDCPFVKYLASKDIEIGNLMSNVYCDLSGIVLNIVRSVGNITEGIEKTSKVVSKILPWAAMGLIAWGGYKFLK